MDLLKRGQPLNKGQVPIVYLLKRGQPLNKGQVPSVPSQKRTTSEQRTSSYSVPSQKRTTSEQRTSSYSVPSQKRTTSEQRTSCLIPHPWQGFIQDLFLEGEGFLILCAPAEQLYPHESHAATLHNISYTICKMSYAISCYFQNLKIPVPPPPPSMKP